MATQPFDGIILVKFLFQRPDSQSMGNVYILEEVRNCLLLPNGNVTTSIQQTPILQSEPSYGS
jgi:hypothetical protein